MLRNVIGVVDPDRFGSINYLVELGLFNFFPKFLDEYTSNDCQSRSLMKLVARNEFLRKNSRCIPEEVWVETGRYMDKLRPRYRRSFWRKKLTYSDSIIFLFGMRHQPKELEDYERLSRSLNSLVLKSSKKKIKFKDLYFLTAKYDKDKVNRALKLIRGIEKRIEKGGEPELKALYNEAIENVGKYTMDKSEKNAISGLNRPDCNGEVGLSDHRASTTSIKSSISDRDSTLVDESFSVLVQTVELSPDPSQDVVQSGNKFETGQESANSISEKSLVSSNSETVTAMRDFRAEFPLGSLLALLDPSGEKNLVQAKFTKESEKIEYWINQLKQCPPTDGFLAAVEDLNLYWLANDIEIDVNKTFNIDAPTKNDIITFLTDHQVGLKNENLIRAYLSTAGHPKSNRHAIAAAMRQTYNNFPEGRQFSGDRFEADLIKAISLYVIRNQLYSNIDLALEANKQRINDFLDTNTVTIPYMAERNVLNLLGLVGRYEDESIVHACRLPIPKWCTIQVPIKIRFLDRNKLYYKGVFNLFVAWQKINNPLSSERAEERIFCSEFISKLVEQSAGNYSEALVEGIQNFCAVHEFDAYPDFLQPFFKENNRLCEFLDSNWDKLLSNINIFRSLGVLATAGMPGTNDDDIVNIINSHELRGFGNLPYNFEAVNVSKELLFVAAATNQIDKLKMLKDPDAHDYVPTFQSLLHEILSSEKLSDTALSKSERISKAIRQLKPHLYARNLKLPAFEELQSFLKSKDANVITGQPDALEFLDLFEKTKNENNSDKFKRLADLPQIPLDNDPPSGIFDYLVASYRLFESMIEAKVPLSVFKVEDFPNLRVCDAKGIFEYDDLIDENQVTKADKILGQIYRLVKNSDGAAPENFLKVARIFNLFSLARGGSPINKSKWWGLEISDKLVKKFKKKESNIPEEIAKDNKLMKDFLLFHGPNLEDSNSIVNAMNLRLEYSIYKDEIRLLYLQEKIGIEENKSSKFENNALISAVNETA